MNSNEPGEMKFRRNHKYPRKESIYLEKVPIHKDVGPLSIGYESGRNSHHMYLTLGLDIAPRTFSVLGYELHQTPPLHTLHRPLEKNNPSLLRDYRGFFFREWVRRGKRGKGDSERGFGLGEDYTHGGGEERGRRKRRGKCRWIFSYLSVKEKKNLFGKWNEMEKIKMGYLA